MSLPWILHRTRRLLRRRRDLLPAWIALFAIVGGLASASVVARRAAAELRPKLVEDVHLVAYLAEDADEARAAALGDVVRRVPGVRAVAGVGAAAAAERLRSEARRLNGAADWVDRLEDGFLPRSLEITLEPAADLPSRAAALAARLRRIPGVAGVDAMADGVARLERFMTILSALGWTLPALAAVAGLALIGYALARRRTGRGEEARVLALVGETPVIQRMPDLLVGAAGGAIGAAVGLAAAPAALMAWSALADVLSVRALSAAELGAGIATAALLGGALGARILPSATPELRSAPAPRMPLGRGGVAVVIALGGPLAFFAGAPGASALAAPADAHAPGGADPVAARLNTREAILAEQHERARARARREALAAYRLLRLRQAAFMTAPAQRRNEAQAVGAALAVLGRSLAEAAAYEHELHRIRTERHSLTRAPAHGAQAPDTSEPGWPGASGGGKGGRVRFTAPVSAKGPLVSTPGLRPDPPTGVLARAEGVRYLGRADEAVRAPADGIVRRVEAQPQGGFVVVLEHAAGFVSIIQGMREASVEPGAAVKRGAALGRLGRTLDGAPVATWELRRFGAAVDPRDR